MIKIVIADDNEEIRKYFGGILEREPDMEIVGTASSGQEVCEVVLEAKPDIVLMDIQMETDMAGICAIERIKEKFEEVKIIVLTIHEEDEILFKAYAAGAVDYIIKTSSVVDIINSIRNVYNNKLSLRPEVAQKILTEFSRLRNEEMSLINTLNIVSRLTNTEFEILKAVYNGYTYKQIAAQRFVEEVTVRTQVNRILGKFGKKSMKEVVKLLEKLRLFEVYNSL